MLVLCIRVLKGVKKGVRVIYLDEICNSDEDSNQEWKGIFHPTQGVALAMDVVSDRQSFADGSVL